MTTLLRWPGLLLLLTVVTLDGRAATQQPAGVSLDELLAQYEAGDRQAIARGVSGRNYRLLVRDLNDTLARWSRDRRAVQTAFLLEFVRAGFIDLNDEAALKALGASQEFVMARRDPPGRNPAQDDLELIWHKAAVGLAQGLSAPMLVNDLLGPLRRRIVATPPVPARDVLVDPWIVLADAIALEQRALADPRTLPSEAPRAIRRFDDAAAFAGTRAEALVRKSWLLVRLGQHANALAALEGLRDPIDDRGVRCWSALVRGRALDGLDRVEAATQAYEDALVVAPHSQSALAALTALEIRRGRPDIAVRRAAEARLAPSSTVDPWLQYGSADYRFFRERVERLRTAGR